MGRALRERRRLLVALALPALVIGCAAPQSVALRGEVPSGVPLAVELEDVPFHPQTPLHCGPAALATVLGHVGFDVAPQTLSESMFLPARGGTLQVEVLAAARRQGAIAVAVPGRLEAVIGELAAGHAVLVLQNLGLAIAPRWHYAVVVGHDLSRGELLLRSGTERRQVMSLSTFEHTWARAGHWAVVVLPPGRLPVTASADDALQATLAFERVAGAAAAVPAWQALQRRWPDLLAAAIGLGQALLAAGDTTGAVQAFGDAARRLDRAAAWNNLAWVHWQRGEREAALQAAQRAVALASRPGSADARWLEPAQRTLDTVAR